MDRNPHDERAVESSTLPQRCAEQMPMEELVDEQQPIQRDDRVTIRDTEHLVYYRCFHNVFSGSSPLRRFTADSSRSCGCELSETSALCRTCGAFPRR